MLGFGGFVAEVDARRERTRRRARRQLAERLVPFGRGRGCGLARLGVSTGCLERIRFRFEIRREARLGPSKRIGEMFGVLDKFRRYGGGRSVGMCGGVCVCLVVRCGCVLARVLVVSFVFERRGFLGEGCLCELGGFRGIVSDVRVTLVFRSLTGGLFSDLCGLVMHTFSSFNGFVMLGFASFDSRVMRGIRVVSAISGCVFARMMRFVRGLFMRRSVVLRRALQPLRHAFVVRTGDLFFIGGQMRRFDRMPCFVGCRVVLSGCRVVRMREIASFELGRVVRCVLDSLLVDIRMRRFDRMTFFVLDGRRFGVRSVLRGECRRSRGSGRCGRFADGRLGMRHTGFVCRLFMHIMLPGRGSCR